MSAPLRHGISVLLILSLVPLFSLAFLLPAPAMPDSDGALEEEPAPTPPRIHEWAMVITGMVLVVMLRSFRRRGHGAG